MKEGNIQTSIANKIAEVTFYHPASNSFPSALLKSLTEEFEKLSENKEVQIIILKSQGDRAFCAGASFDELLEVKTKEEGILFFMGFANLINAMRTCKKVILGEIQGKAVGGGVGLAAACDYCFATEAASIKLSELFIGIGAFVIEPAVLRKIGKSAFTQLTLDATEWHTAEWAKEKGLFAKVYASKEEMMDAAQSLAKKLANYHPEALFQMKKVFWEGTAHWTELLAERAEISGELMLSDFTRKTLLKFKK
ncbi:enoyl-CoA hydratase/isomerase family protein [Flavicella sediminum]|uniref:enoyl-CoA hydratase/isomerase family protein n=1 Tax=Flavicella sediminum TaxID=2585141 RepID=UPI00111D54A3|nr:enoyl-CoA hydratase/isomerase family protein [Flavicella sediminum]